MRPEQGPSVQPIASPLTSPSPRQVKQLQQAPWRPPFCTVLSPGWDRAQLPSQGDKRLAPSLVR